MSRQRWLIAVMTILACAANLSAYQHGKVEHIQVHSIALEHNLVNDSAERDVTVYLPPEYEPGTRRFPVLYLLHGYTGTDRGWLNADYVDVPGAMDRLLARRAIQPMIVVMPNSFNRLGGSMYTNSTLSGNWEDFVVRDLVGYMDAHYRTIASAGSRGIAGHSMGGYGALKLALQHPNIFSAVYGLSACCAEWTETLLPDARTAQQLRVAKNLGEVVKDGIDAQMGLTLAAAFSPNPENAPLGVDWPFDAKYRPEPSVIAKWKAQMLDAVLSGYVQSSERLHAIAFDVGKQDENRDILTGSRALDKLMTRLAVPHVYSEYQGTHGDRIAERMERFVLPFMSGALTAPPANPISKAAGS